MILCLDIGNSTLAAGLYRGGRIVQRASLVHRGRLDAGSVKSFLKRSLNASSGLRAAMISVVPSLVGGVYLALKQLQCAGPRVITVRDLSPLIRHAYRRPQRLGVDRLINAYAAWCIYGAPVVVVDIGTAITWDGVDRSGRFIGGAIAPGPQTMSRALSRQTALLPELSIRRPVRAAGRDTEGCIRSGIFWGTAAMVRELAERIGGQVGGRPRVILTGGAARIFLLELRGFRYDPDLTLKGIGLASEVLDSKETD